MTEFHRHSARAELFIPPTMNKEKFLNSGLLEQYVLGLTTVEENKLVEHYADTFPEVREELRSLKGAMDAYVADHISPARPGAGRAAVENGWTAPAGKISFKGIGLPWIIACVFGLIIFYLSQARTADRRHLTQLEAEHAALQQYYDRDHQDEDRQRTMTSAIQDSRTVSTVLQPAADSELSAFAVYHYNPATEKNWLDATQLPFLEPARVYNVWNVGLEEPQLIGTLRDNRRQLLELTYRPASQAVEITIGRADAGADYSAEELLLRGQPLR